MAEVSFRLGQVCLARTRQEPTWQIAVCNKLEQKLNLELEAGGVHACMFHGSEILVLKKCLTSTLSGQFNLSLHTMVATCSGTAEL